jgi:hypothetical protein
MVLKRLRYFPVLLLILEAAGCGGGQKTQLPISISIVPQKAAIAAGRAIQFAASVANCLYSTGMILQIDEQAKTATFAFHSPAPYSSWGGSAQALKNGNLEYTVSSVPTATGTSQINEVTQGTPSQTVWQLKVGSNAYRALRMSSLYPGIQW